MSLYYLYNGDLLIYILGLFSKQKLNTRKRNPRSAINSKELKGKKTTNRKHKTNTHKKNKTKTTSQNLEKFKRPREAKVHIKFKIGKQFT